MGNASTRKVSKQRRHFMKAHRQGMDALARGDYGALGDAIDTERKVIKEQRKVIDTAIRKARNR